MLDVFIIFFTQGFWFPVGQALILFIMLKLFILVIIMASYILI